MSGKIAVIGAGIAGIAVAIRLAVKGFRVEVFEQNESAGGKMSEIRHKGFRFDTGPSLFTMPKLIHELFELAGEQMTGNLDYHKLDTVCRYFYDEGMVINGFGSPGEFAAELHSKTGEDPERVKAYLEQSYYIFELTYPVFIRNSLHRARNYFTPDFLRALFLLPRIKPFKTLHQINRKYFKHDNTIKLFDRFATYNGSNPYRTPATMMVIPHLEHNIGAYFPSGGMRRIAQSLVQLAEKTGVEFHYDSRVEKILLSGKSGWGTGRKVKGIQLNGLEMNDYSYIITDLDIYYVYRQLLDELPFPEKWFSHERSTSALIFYWGMNLKTAQLDVHNILFASDYAMEFQCLAGSGSLSPDPTVYLFISSKVLPEDAPQGCENWFVMINTPPESGQNWEKLIPEARWAIEKKIKHVLGITVHEHRLFEFILDPPGIEKKTASYRGSLYGNSSNSVWAAFQRHPNCSGIRGLYHVGGSVHPGGGIPLCLSSARIVADMITCQKTSI